jgi:rubrerythrin
MPVLDVPHNWRDYSNDQGYQFSFHCDICGREYKCTYIASAAYKSSRTATLAGEFLGGTFGHIVSSSNSSDRLSAKQRAEKDDAFGRSWNEIQKYFRKCPRDHIWACCDCWNADSNLCVTCSPRLGVEMAAAQSQVAVQQMHQAVSQSTQFHGDATQKVGSQCPSCGQYTTGGGKFCNFCGAVIAQPGCPTCGFQNAPNAKFCGGCGGPLK